MLSSSLSDLRRYSFCKSHAISYGKLVWALAYCKATLKHCHSAYRKWVHYNEAKTTGVKLKKPTKYKNEIDGDNKQYLEYGYWLSSNFIENCYLTIIPQDNPGLPNEYYVKFRGLIATGRVNKSNTYINEQQINMYKNEILINNSVLLDVLDINIIIISLFHKSK